MWANARTNGWATLRARGPRTNDAPTHDGRQPTPNARLQPGLWGSTHAGLHGGWTPNAGRPDDEPPNVAYGSRWARWARWTQRTHDEYEHGHGHAPTHDGPEGCPAHEFAPGG